MKRRPSSLTSRQGKWPVLMTANPGAAGCPLHTGAALAGATVAQDACPVPRGELVLGLRPHRCKGNPSLVLLQHLPVSSLPWLADIIVWSWKTSPDL